MKPHVVLIDDWPQPDTVTRAAVAARGSRLAVCYGSDERFVVLALPYSDMKMGGPNDETLNGHPLYEFGLKHYSIHRIENSPWLQELERQNSVHPRHTSAWFLNGKVHYLIALKEQTIECVAIGTEVQIETFESQHSALEHLKASLGA